MRSTTLYLLGAGLISAAGQAAALPGPIINGNYTTPFADIDIDIEHPIYTRDSKVPLRILPFGASIVFGIGSTLSSDSSRSGNGYGSFSINFRVHNCLYICRFRKPLRDALRYGGWEVDMVGTQHSGDMQDWVCLLLLYVFVHFKLFLFAADNITIGKRSHSWCHHQRRSKLLQMLCSVQAQCCPHQPWNKRCQQRYRYSTRG